MSGSVSPLPWTGSKGCIYTTIDAFMPPHKTYVEACMGSAEVFLRKKPSEREIINDYNGDLVKFFRVLQRSEKLAYLLGRLYLSFNSEQLFKSNIAQKGTITIEKTGEVFATVRENNGFYQPVYKIQGLAGAVYEITAAEDIITLDGTVRYTKGQLVATITTGADGKATTEPLYLGKFTIKEITAPYGITFNYGNYKAYVIIGRPKSSSAFLSVTLPSHQKY